MTATQLKNTLIDIAVRYHPNVTREHLVKRMGFTDRQVDKAIENNWLEEMSMPGFFIIKIR